ncbi:restriction endonuclease [Fusobacterium sp. MFO224]|uniref:restriction endonuclease n=1 Tax=Fusobacterium sp. MFO224 TaxID=3378070 RepID=UPI00385551B6
MNENTEYEILTKEIYEALLEKEGYSNIINVQHNINIKGKSGCQHQIDVYFEYEIAGITQKIAIECKNYQSRVPIGKIRDFNSVLNDIDASGIFVAREGFQAGAKEYAEYCGIKLREIRFPNLEDWEGLIREIHLSIHARHIQIKERTPILDKIWIKKNLNYKKGEEIFKFSGTQKEFIIYDQSGNKVTDLYQIESQLKTFEKTKYDIKFTYELENCYVKNSTGILLKIKSFEFKYDSFNTKIDNVINGEDSVKAILKEVETGEIQFFNKKNI